MSYVSNSFRVFVSSTFKDMEAERNYLQKNIFPRLSDLCKSYGFEFQAIDLRWGIDEEASVDQNGVRICIDELKRCQEISPRPNLIVLVGERYGWTPPPTEISEIEFQKIIPYISKRKRRLVNFWYRLDTNSLISIDAEAAFCGTYKLAPRRGIHAKWKEYQEWGPVESQLRNILYTAAQKAGLDEKRLLKYYASATHQEIITGAFEPQDAKEHVHFFMKSILGVSSTENLKDFVEIDSKKKDLLENLKKIVRKEFSTHVHEYSVHSGNITAFEQYLKEFGQQVFDAIWTNIESQMSQFGKKSEIEQENESQMDFARNRTKIFVGRNDILEKIMQYLNDESHNPLIITGSSGSGKSALLAKIVDTLNKANLTSMIFPRFIGTTVISSNSLSLLSNLHLNFVIIPNISSKTTDILTDKVLTDYPKFARYFAEFLQTCNTDTKIVILIDAVDQLKSNDRGRDLQWIPKILGNNIKLIISCASDAEDLMGILITRFKSHILQISSLTIQEGDEILKLLLKESSRTLTPSQSEQILMKFKKLGNPLFLKIAFEISRRWNSYDPPESTILPDNIESLIENYLSSLMTQHDPEFIKRVLGYIITARFGLTESEIVEILSFDSDYFNGYYRKKIFHSLPEPKLPWIVWSRFFAVMQQFFTQSGVFNVKTISLFHRQFEQIIRNLFLSDAIKKRSHQILAEYFTQKSLYYKEGENRTINYRKLSELIYQLRAAEMYPEIEDHLTNLEFIDANCRAGLIDSLLQEFSELMQVKEDTWTDSLKLQEIHALLRNKAHVIRKFPNLLLQEAANQPEYENIAINAENILTHSEKKQPFLKLLNKKQEKSPLRMTYQGHLNSVSDCCFSPDGSMIVSASSDNTLILWNAKTGMPIKTLYGHTKEVKSCDISRDGTKILSGSSDCTIKLWDVKSGVALKTYTFQGNPIEYCKLSKDATKIIAACNDGTIQLLDIKLGIVLKTFKGHSKAVARCRFSPDESKILSSSDDFTLKLWDVEKCEEIFTLKGHTGWIHTCEFSPDGDSIISGSFDTTLRVWDVKTGKELTSFRTSSFMNWINASAYSPDGSFIAFGCGSSLITWNPKTNEQLSNISNDDYYCLTFSPDGSQILTGCRDNTLKLWDVNIMRNRYLSHGTRDILSENILGFSPDGAMFITAESQYSLKLMESVSDAQYIVKLWDSNTRKVVKSLKGHPKEIISYSFSPDNTQLITGSLDHTINIWDIASGTPINVLHRESPKRGDYLKLCSHSLDGKNLITLSNENTVQIWDIKSGTLLKTTSNAVRNCTKCIFSPDKTKILIIDSSRTLRLWNLSTDNPSVPLEGFYVEGLYYTFAFSPDNKTFITKAGKNDMLIWDAHTGKILRSFPAHAKEICTCEYSPDGCLFLTGSVDNTIKLWDTQSATNVRILTDHFGSITTSIFSKTGDLIISGANDDTLRIWETKTGKNIAIFPEAHFIRAIAINADGLIIAVDSSGLIMLQLNNYEEAY